MADINETLKLYEEAIKVCEQWRSKKSLIKATPNEVRLYNVFTQAKNVLSAHKACMEDVLGVYMKGTGK